MGRRSEQADVPGVGNRVGLPIGVVGAGPLRHREQAAFNGVCHLVVPEIEDQLAARGFEANVLTVALEPGHADELVISGLAEAALMKRAGHGSLLCRGR